MKVALVHYWLLGSRGGEKVLEAICRIFPDADIFTLFYDPESVPALIRSKNVKASFLNPFKKFHRSLLPLMPMALEAFDLRPYDLIISSESGPAKGVLTSSTSRHICYCHTPMRYLWELYPAYRNEFQQGVVSRALMAPIANYLRTWDYATAARVDTFMANSRNVKRRIWKTYRRKSRVVYPPVPVESFHYSASQRLCFDGLRNGGLQAPQLCCPDVFPKRAADSKSSETGRSTPACGSSRRTMSSSVAAFRTRS